MQLSSSRTRHIINLSGGKDSTALAIYLRDRIPDAEYVFCDTEKELPETYEYIDRLEAYLGKPVVRLKHDGRGFDHHLAMRRGYLPSPSNRWCTELLKLRPFEHYVGNDPVRSYIAIRADEDREGYISHKPNITPVYPFKEAGIVREDVVDILESSGIGLAGYYEWRSRSGCYFCFFQQKIEWIGLLKHHPDLFREAQRYEEFCQGQPRRYTWTGGESLAEIASPSRIAEIELEHKCRMKAAESKKPNKRLVELFSDVIEEDEYDRACLICDL